MSSAAAQDEAEDRYYTQVDEGDVRLFTLDQLDAAFNVGLIHENTYVCLEGASEWLTLGEVAGLAEEAPASAPLPTAAAAYQGALAASPSVMPSTAYNSVAPVVMPRSLAPVWGDLGDDEVMQAMRPKRRAGKVVAGLAVLGLAGLGFAVVHSGGLKLPKLNLADGVGQASAASLTLSTLKDAVATPPQAPTPVAEATHVEPAKAEELKPVDAAKPAEAAPGSDAASKPNTDARFSEDMKAALLNKDKQHLADQKHKKAKRTAVAVRRGVAGKASKGSSPGFKSGGSAYDPLNAKL